MTLYILLHVVSIQCHVHVQWQCHIITRGICAKRTGHAHGTFKIQHRRGGHRSSAGRAISIYNVMTLYMTLYTNPVAIDRSRVFLINDTISISIVLQCHVC